MTEAKGGQAFCTENPSSTACTPMHVACSTEFDQGYGIENFFGLRFASRA